MSTKPTNIVFIHAESMDGRKMGCMGAAPLRSATPNLDALADRGVLFTNAYSTCPVCNPSRASMWSGRYPHVYDCWNNHEGLALDVPTFRTALAAAGVHTEAVGPLDYTHGLHSIRDRIGSWTRAAEIERPICRTPLPVVRTEEVNGRDWQHAHNAMRWMTEAAADARPFMLYLTTGLVHPAFVAEERHLATIDEASIDVPPTVGEITSDTHPVDRYVRITKNCNTPFEEPVVRRIRSMYFAMIAALDELVGRVIRHVEELGIADSTYIIFSSDHGEMAGEHNQVLKRTMFEPSIHVPLIVSGPEVRRGASVETPVSLIDLYPTLMDMAGAKGRADADGESLMPQLTEGAVRSRDWAFAEYNGDRCNTGVYMLRRGRFKYIHHEGYPAQLFDLSTDPWEEHDVSHSNPKAVAEMEAILAEGIASQTPGEIDRRAKQYDRASFLEWSRNAREAGTYEETMSHVYSGFDRQCIEDLVPWREEDEARIRAWLSAGA